MSRRWVPAALVVCAVVHLLAPGRAGAQSLFSGYVFGSPLEIGDARQVALGSVGIGIGGTPINPHDPAAGVDLVLPSVAFTGQSTWGSASQEGTTSDFTASRFPSIGIVYPIPGVVSLSASFTGVLDQNWEVAEERLLSVGESGTQGRVTDRFASDGGVSSLRFGVARRITPNVSVGINAGTYLGDVTRRFARSFDSIPADEELPDFQVGGNWSYGGAVAAVGSVVEFPGVGRLAGSVTWGGEIRATPSGGTDGAGVTLDMPFEYRLGGTAILSQALFVNAGVHLADYSSAVSELDGVAGVSMFRFGGGLEWSGLSLLGKTSALRLGYRRGEMPFRPASETDILESVISGGLGISLLEVQGAVLAEADFGVEWGARDSSLFTEDFFRVSASLRMSIR